MRAPCFATLVAAAVADAAPEPVDTGSAFWHMGYQHTESEAGLSYYTHMWNFWPQGVPKNWGVGLPSTWLHSTHDSDFDEVCACNPNGWPNNPEVAPGDQANGCCDKGRGGCGFLYETIEGGPQDDERWRTGANVGCFQYTAGAGLFNYGQEQHPCDEIAFASLSNQLLMQPNGLSFAKDGMLGVGYVRTPLGKTHDGDNRTFWTLVFDTETFSGPLGYYLPEFFNGRDRSAASEGGHPDPEWYEKSKGLNDMSSPGMRLNNDQFAMEWNHGYTFQQNDSQGEVFYKLPSIGFPFVDGELILATGNRVHNDDQITAPLEEALRTGTLDPAHIMANSTRAKCHETSDNATFHIDASGREVKIGVMVTLIENDNCVWKLTGDGDFLNFPHYFNKDLKPVDESRVPSELAAQEFELDTSVFSRVFDALGSKSEGCYTQPGPADAKLYCAKSDTNGYWVSYRWYKFVDQPALQRAALSQAEREYMQRRAETLHRMVGRVSRWLKPGALPAAGADLAHVDPVALVTPPAGLEYGYVPIVFYEGAQKPSECGDAPAPTPPGPSPPGPAPDAYVVADQAYLCPSGYEAIQGAEDCKAAAVALDELSSHIDVTPQADRGDPVGCWAYGASGQYSYLYLNSQGSTEGVRPMRSAICRKLSTVV